MEKLILGEIEKLVKERNELRLQLEEAKELLRRRNSEMGKTDLDYPECPHCGTKAIMTPEIANMQDMDEIEITCHRCGMPYRIEAFYSVTYDCCKVEGLK